MDIENAARSYPSLVNSDGRPATIMQVIPRLDAGGAEEVCLELAQAIVSAGANSIIVCQEGRLARQVETAGTRVIFVPVASKSPLNIIANAPKLAHLIHLYHVDIVHAHSRAPAWSAYLATRRGAARFVTSYHSAYGRKSWFKRQYNSVMARGDVVIANSQFTGDHIRQNHPRFADRIKLVYGGTDLALFDPAQISDQRRETLRRAWKLHQNDRILLLPARLTRQKGHVTAIDAMGILSRRNLANGAILICAGDAQGRDRYQDVLIRHARDTGISDQIRFVGHCCDMAAAYALSQLVIIPSLTGEGFGRTAVQAQAMGVPVIGSDIGALRETIIAPPTGDAVKRTGWRVPPGNAEQLALAIEAGMDMHELERDALAMRARAHVGANFTGERMTRDSLALYQQLMTNHSDQS